ncbi:hypothetical protein [Nostoc sp.]|uniref:hypothetical protein n=1 Tax=Nostoc sp. TaxID=1180 RepID=UPI002FF68F25
MKPNKPPTENVGFRFSSQLTILLHTEQAIARIGARLLWHYYLSNANGKSVTVDQ